jgi:threonylcarbamoyladenosine tRNA methylthiotransferase MtaB
MEYRETIQMVRRHVPVASITTDIMVGFPGESDAEFTGSYQFCREMEFAAIHVFPYSPRPGTTAAEMDGQVDTATKKKRSQAMMALGREAADRYRKQFLGQTHIILWENEAPGDAGLYDGLTRHYIRVFTRSARSLSNQLVPACLVSSFRQGFWGEVVK